MARTCERDQVLGGQADGAKMDRGERKATTGKQSDPASRVSEMDRQPGQVRGNTQGPRPQRNQKTTTEGRLTQSRAFREWGARSFDTFLPSDAVLWAKHDNLQEVLICYGFCSKIPEWGV